MLRINYFTYISTKWLEYSNATSNLVKLVTERVLTSCVEVIRRHEEKETKGLWGHEP